MSSYQDLDDYLADSGFDVSDYGEELFPTGTSSGSSSYPTSSGFSFDDYDFSDFDYEDYLNSDDLDDWLNDYLGSSDSTDDYPWSSSSDSPSSSSSSDLPFSSSTSSSDSSPSGSSSSDSPTSWPYDSFPDSSDFPSSSSGDFSSYGSFGSIQETSDKCITEVAFKETGPRVDLAFDVIFLVLYLALLGIAAFRFFKSKRKGAALGKYFLFPVSLFFALLYLLIDMITLILTQCVMMKSNTYQLAQTAVSWFEYLSVYLLIVLILLPICLKLQHGGGKIATLTLVIHSVWLALCGIILLVGLAIYTRIQDARFRSGDVDKSIAIDLPKASRGITMAYHVFLFLAALLGSANMALALFRKANIRKGALLLSIPGLILSMLILTLVLMGGFADLTYGDMGRSPKYFQASGDAQVFLTRLFYALAFLAALVIAGSHQTTDEAAAEPIVPSQPVAQYNPVAPVPEHAQVPVPAPYAPANVA